MGGARKDNPEWGNTNTKTEIWCVPTGNSSYIQAILNIDSLFKNISNTINIKIDKSLYQVSKNICFSFLGTIQSLINNYINNFPILSRQCTRYTPVLLFVSVNFIIGQ